MKNGTRMLLTAKLWENGYRRDDGTERDMHREYYPGWPYPMYNNEVEDRFRDRRGREHYDNGRYAPRNESRGTLTWDTNKDERHDERLRADRNEVSRTYPYRIGYNGGEYGEPYSDMDEVEARRRYRRDSRGRFRSDMDDEDMDMHYPVRYPFPPPVYENPQTAPKPIGFSANAKKERGNDHMNEMEPRGNLRMLMGGASSNVQNFDMEMAEEWMAGLENEDGTKGPHWSMDQIKQVLAQKNWNEDPVKAWVVMNMVYSDYCGVAKKVNANNIDFYVSMAKAFLDDKDASKDKLARYFEYVVK